MELIHTCYRIGDPERSIAFYEALGFEKRREQPIRDEAVNYFFGVPGQPNPELELTYNFGVSEYEIGAASATSPCAWTISRRRWSSSLLSTASSPSVRLTESARRGR